MAYPIQQGNVTLPLRFTLVSNSDHITGATGKTPTVTIDKNDGLGFVTPSGSVTEVGNGRYQVAANATDAAHLGVISLHATASGCDPFDDDFFVVNFNPTATASQAPTSPTTITVADLGAQVLRRLNVVQPGVTPTPEDLADFLLMLNDFIDSVCGLEKLLIYSITRTTWTIVSGTGTYSVGPSGDVNIVRPIYIDQIKYQDTSGTLTEERPLWPLTDAQYENLPFKTQTNPLPSMVYYNPTFPTASLKLLLVPTSTTLQGVLYANTAVTRFGALTDVIALPPGYNRFLRDNMAVECAPTWRDGLPLDPGIVRSAMESKANLKRANIRPLDMAVPTFRGGFYDINADRIF